MKKLLIILCLLNSLALSAQLTDSLIYNFSSKNYNKARSILIQRDKIFIDSFTLQPNSLILKQGDLLLSDSCWVLKQNYLYWKKGCSYPKDSVHIHYRVFPYAIHQRLFKKNQNLISQDVNIGEDIVVGKGYSYNPYQQNDEFVDFKGLEYNGSFARGISLGNRQDLILNSSFNLQLNGMLGDVEVIASLSDNNIPLQPEGNTQQLQDFDRIYLKFKLKDHYLLAGDYDLKSAKDSYFLNYYRRLQGGQIGTSFTLNNKADLDVDMSFAISKGRFTRNTFTGEEGNQGPYRLKGAKGELFLIILAGTERVFMDGVLMERGADKDYVIDYNLGEITFTNKQLITKDKRIQVEFSYTDLNYLRTIYTFNTFYQQKKTRLRFSWYSEQDAKNQSVQANLSDSAKLVLSNIGNNIEEAYVWGASIPEESEGFVGLVRYELRDSLVNGVRYDSVLVSSNDPEQAIYTVRFSAIEGGGHYLRVNDATNGTIYKWVAPDPISGALLGTHEPLELLSAPKKRQMLNVGYDYQLGKKGLLKADFAFSNNDPNTFSSIGNLQNRGIAGRLTYQQNFILHQDSTLRDSVYQKSKLQLILNAHYEYLQKRFEVIEPYRLREFQRDWNTNVSQQTAEHLFRTTTILQGSQWGQLRYELSGLIKDSLYQGIKQNLSLDIEKEGLKALGEISYLLTESTIVNSQFLRPKLDISYQIKAWNNFKLGIYGEQEQNRKILVATDSFENSSFYYNLVKTYIEFPSTKRLFWKGAVQRRYDYTPVGAIFETLTIADELNFAGNWELSNFSKLLWNLNYRNLKIIDTSKTELDPKETYLGRVEYSMNWRKGFVRMNTVYELGAGQQQKIAYNYLEVDQGQGTHVWIDRNEDGIQQQNEFEQAVFQDQANFLRVNILTGEFIRSNNVRWSQSIDLNPKVLFARKSNHKSWSWVKRLSSRSLFQIERKTLPTTEVLAFNPFQFNVADTSLVAISSNIRNILYYNRSSPKFRAALQQSDTRSKTLLNIGFNSRQKKAYQLRSSWKVGTFFRGQLELGAGEQKNASEFFPERDYALQFYEFKPQLSYMLKTTFRALLHYRFKDNSNQINHKETARLHDITLEGKYFKSKGANTNIRFSFSWVKLKFDGEHNTAVEFAMTEGLKNGQNYLWSLNFDRALSKSVQLSLGYEGRKTGKISIIHLGHAQIRALF